jgi:hypothetical protein
MNEDDPDAPKLARDVTHARIGNLLFDMREVVNDLIALRLNPVGNPLVADEEGELTAIKNSLDWLLSDIRESRPKVRLVK